MSYCEVPGASDAMAVAPVAEQRTARSMYHHLRMAGLTATEAGNLTAHLSGLHVAAHGWSLKEIERLLFVRALVERGRIAS